VMGHGITAALATGSFKSAFSIYIKQFGPRPGFLLKALNDHFYEEILSSANLELFASCLYAYVDTHTRKMRVARAGHHYPILYRKKDDNFVDLSFQGIALGMTVDTEFEQIDLEINPGDKILFFTDGIIEQKDEEGEMYSLDRLRSSFLKGIHDGDPDLLEMIRKDLKTFSGNSDLEDDTTIFLLELQD